MCEAAEVAAETGASAGFGRFGAAVLLDDAASEVRFGGPKDNFCWASGIAKSLARNRKSGLAEVAARPKRLV